MPETEPFLWIDEALDAYQAAENRVEDLREQISTLLDGLQAVDIDCALCIIGSDLERYIAAGEHSREFVTRVGKVTDFLHRARVLLQS